MRAWPIISARTRSGGYILALRLGMILPCAKSTYTPSTTTFPGQAINHTEACTICLFTAVILWFEPARAVYAYMYGMCIYVHVLHVVLYIYIYCICVVDVWTSSTMKHETWDAKVYVRRADRNWWKSAVRPLQASVLPAKSRQDRARPGMVCPPASSYGCVWR